MILAIISVIGVVGCIFFGFITYKKFQEDEVTINAELCDDGVVRGIVVDIETGSYNDQLSAYKTYKKIQATVEKGKSIIDKAKVEAAKEIYKGQVNQIDAKSDN